MGDVLASPRVDLQVCINDKTSATLPRLPVLSKSGEAPPVVHCWSVEGKPLRQVDIAAALRDFFEGAAEQENTSMTVAEIESRAPVELAGLYAERLHGVWPSARVYFRRSEEDASCVEVCVVGREWDADHEGAAYRLMFEPELRSGDLQLDVVVWFEENCAPDLTGYLPVG